MRRGRRRKRQVCRASERAAKVKGLIVKMGGCGLAMGWLPCLTAISLSALFIIYYPPKRSLYYRPCVPSSVRLSATCDGTPPPPPPPAPLHWNTAARRQKLPKSAHSQRVLSQHTHTHQTHCADTLLLSLSSLFCPSD